MSSGSGTEEEAVASIPAFTQDRRVSVDSVLIPRDRENTETNEHQTKS